MTFFETGKAVVSEGVIGVGNYDILRKILMEAGCLADDIMLQIEETKRKIKCIETTKRHDFSSSESLSRSKGVLVGLSVASYCAAVEYQHDALLIPSLVIEENIPMETTFSFSTSLCSENWWVSSGPDFASILSKFTVYQDEVYQHDALFPVLARLVDQENKSIEKILTASRCYLTKANYKKNMTFLETLIALESEGVIGIGNYEILIRILEKAGCLSDDTMLAIEETTQKPKCSEISIRVSFLFSVNPVLKLDHVLLKREKVLEILGSSKMLISNIFSFKSFNEPQNQRMCLDTEVVLLYFSMNGQAHESSVFFLSVSAVSELLLASTEKMEESMFFGVTASETRERSSWKTPCFSERALHSRIGPQICGIFIAFYIKRRTYHQPALFSEPGHWLGKKDKSESEDWIGVGVYDILRKIIDEAGCLYDAKQKIIFSETSFLFSVNHGLKLDVVLPKKDKVLKTFGSSKILKSYIKSFNSFNEPQNQRICRNSEVVPQYFSVNGRTSGSGVFFRTVSADRKELIQTSSTKEMEESVFLVFTASEPRESSSWKTPCFSERALQNKIGQQGFGISNACYSEEACQTYNRNSKPATRSGQGNLWMKFSLFMLILLGTSVGGSCLPASCPGEILKANVSRDVLIWVNDSKPIRIKRFYLNHLTPQEKETCVSDPVVTEGVERAVVMCVLAVFLQWQIWQHLFYVSFQGLPRTSGESSRLLMIRVFLCLTVNGSAAESVPKGVGLDDCEFCHQICQPNIMKMNCDKYCSNLCGNERFSAEVFITEPGRDTLYDTVKWFGIVSAVMVIILLLHLFVFSEVSNHLSQGCHDMPGPESVVNDNHCLMYSKRCLFSVFMEAIEKSNLDSKTHNDSVDNDSKEDGDIHSSLKHNNTSEQQREVTLCTSEEPSERKSYDIDSETDDTNATNKNKQITDLTPCNIPIQERDMMLKYRHELIVPMHTDVSERLDFVGQRIFCLELKPLTIDDSKNNVLVMKERAREEFPLSNSTCPFLDEETFCEVSGFTLDFSFSTDFKLKRRKDFYFNWPVHSRKFKTRVQQMQKLHANYHKPNSSTVREDIRRDRSILDRRICDNSKTEGIQKTMFKDDLFKMTDIEEEMINTNEETHEMNWQFPTQRLYDIPSLPITNNPDRTIADSVVKKGQEDDVDDCDILRNITWLPLEDLPVPQIHTDIIVNNAAQVILDRIAKGETVGAQESMKFEILRVCTYRNYPADNKPFRLLFASAGWYYASDNDEVVCYRCGMRKSNWNEADSPLEIHTKIRPGCDFLVKNSEVNLPIPELESAKLIKFKKLDELLDSSVQIPLGQLPSSGNRGNLELNSSRSLQFRFFTPPPKHPQYALQSVRLDSFKGWPTNIPQTSTTMAECGYYYAGFGDCVRCFYCGIGLRHWTDEDNPWIEHARWSKDCVYLRQMKGEEFIQNVYLAIQEEEEREDVEPETQSGQAGNISQIAPSDDSSQILLTDPAQSVLEMGYQPKIIKKAIDVILHNEGRSGITAMKIMEQIFRFEENSELEQGVANMNIASGSEVQSQNSPRTGQTQNKGNGSKEPNSSTGTKAQSQSVTGQSQENKETRHSGNSPKSQGQKKDTNKKAGDIVQTRSKEPSATGKQEEAAASAKPSQQSSLDENVKGTTSENSKNDTTQIKAENRKLKEQTICKVCLDKAVSIVFLPCGHLVTCAECAPAMKKCPICRGLVKGSVKAFMS